MNKQYKIATLNKEAIHKIQAFEKETGKHLLALDTGVHIAELTSQELKKMQALENELGVVLLAYDG